MEAYRFNCTKCGKALTHETVLYEFLDNLYLLREGSEKLRLGNDKSPVKTASPFQRIRMNLLLNELRKILGNDWQKALTEPVECRLTIENMLHFISNRHNSRFSDLSKLSTADIEAFVFEPSKLRKEAADIIEKFTFVQSEHGTSATDDVLRHKMKKEFEALLNLCNGGVCSFGIELLQDSYNKDIITGFHLHEIGGVGYVQECWNPRICPGDPEDKSNPMRDCSARMFKRAGAARQIQIGFIGKQGAGKTSAILAVADALLQGGLNRDTEDFRALARCISENEIHIENLSEEEIVKKERLKYSRGEAPSKTPVHKVTQADGQSTEISEAYSITLQLREDLLLTLTDIPGEVFDPQKGHIDQTMIKSFQNMLWVDAFVFCYDASQKEENVELLQAPPITYRLPDDIQQELRLIVSLLNGNAAERQKNDSKSHKTVCAWLQEIQKKRADKNGLDGQQVPVLILYMKDPSVERDENIENVKREYNERLNFHGIFRNEQIILETNELGQRYRNFREEHMLKAADKYYYTELRCSPYGFIATNPKVRSNAQEADNKTSQIEEQIGLHIKKILGYIQNLEAQAQEKENAYEAMEKLCDKPDAWRDYFQSMEIDRRRAYGAAEQSLRTQQAAHADHLAKMEAAKSQMAQLREQLTEAAVAAEQAMKLEPEAQKIEERRKKHAAQQSEKEEELNRRSRECAARGKICVDFNTQYQAHLEAGDKDFLQQKEALEALHDAAKKQRDEYEKELRAWEKEEGTLFQQEQPLLQQYQSAKVKSSKHNALKSQLKDLHSKLDSDKIVLERLDKAIQEAQSKADAHEKLVQEAVQYQRMSTSEQKVFFQEQTIKASEENDKADQRLNDAKSVEEFCNQYLKIAIERKNKAYQEYIEITQENRTPKPKNVGHLARWILHVSGAASITLDDSEGQSLGAYYCRPPEFREKDMRKVLERHKNSQHTERSLPNAVLAGMKGLWARFTGSIDRKEFEEYKRIAAAHRYLFVNPTKQEVEMYGCENPSNAAEILNNPD